MKRGVGVAKARGRGVLACSPQRAQCLLLMGRIRTPVYTPVSTTIWDVGGYKRTSRNTETRPGLKLFLYILACHSAELLKSRR